jgi:two-component system, NtrC family, sensor histidine kinase GlrK
MSSNAPAPNADLQQPPAANAPRADRPAETPDAARIRLRYPSSFLALLLAGFIIVSLPPVLGLISSAFSIDRLLGMSQRALYNATQAKENARKLISISETLRRSSLSYSISPAPQDIDNYKLAREEFREALRQLNKLPISKTMQQTAEAVQALEESAFAALENHDSVNKFDAVLKRKLEKIFDEEMYKRNQTLLQLGDEMIASDSAVLSNYAEKSKNQTYWQTAAIVPLAVFLIVVFAYALIRPIRELDDAINRLGQGKLARRIQVSGPRDIRQLGGQLDWLRQRLITLEDQKTRFFQHVSHELKTPLTALREGSDLLSDEVVGPLTAEQREVTKILKENSITLERLIQDLLTYSQSQSAERIAQKTALEIKPLQLRDLIDEVVDTQKIAIVAKAITLRRECEKTSVLGDAAKLRVVIDNLLSNAVKYAPMGGTILIRLGKRNDNAIIEVIDDGPGIPPEEREKIFDPFYRSKTAIATGTKGTGLGLAIVRDYVEMHQGTVTSIAAAGARFRVVLPKQLRAEA